MTHLVNGKARSGSEVVEDVFCASGTEVDTLLGLKFLSRAARVALGSQPFLPAVGSGP